MPNFDLLLPNMAIKKDFVGTLQAHDFIKKTGQFGVYVNGELGKLFESNLVDVLKKHLIEGDDNIKELQEDDNKDEVNHHDDYKIEELDGPKNHMAEDKENGNSYKYEDFLVKDEKTGDVHIATELVAHKLQDIPMNAMTFEEVAKLKDRLTTINELTIGKLGDLIEIYKIVAPTTNNRLSPPFQLNPHHKASKDPIKTSGDMHHGIRKNLIDHVRSELNSGPKLSFGVLQVYTDTRTKTARGKCLFKFKDHKVLQLLCYVNRSDKAHPCYQKVQNIRFPMDMQNSEESGELISLQDAISQGIVNNQVVAYFIGRVYEFYKNIGMSEKLRFKKQFDAECWVAEVKCSGGWIECTKIYGKNDDALEAKLDRIEVEGTVIRPVLSQLKSVFKNNYKKVAGALEAIGEEEEEVRKMTDDFKSKGEYMFSVGTLQTKVTIKPNMVEILTNKKKTVYETVSTYVAEVSFRIGWIIYCLYEHSYDIRDGTSHKVFRFPTLVSPFKCFVIENKTCETVIERIIKSLEGAGIPYMTATQCTRYKNRFIESDGCGCPFAILLNSEDSVTIHERDSNLEINVNVNDMGELIEDVVAQRIKNLLDGV